MNWCKFLLRRRSIAIFAMFLFFCVTTLVYFNLYGFSKIPFNLRQEVKSKLRWVQDLPYFFYKYKAEDTNLPIYALNIKEKDLAQLNENLPEYNEYLADEHKKYQPAKFVFDDKEYDVTVKYRGLHEVHWFYKKKSWRIKFNKDNLFNGAREITLIIPEERDFAMEALNDYRARKLDLISPYRGFIVFKINGKNYGPYLQYDHWGEEFLEKASLRDNANLYGEDIFDYDEISNSTVYNQNFLWKKFAQNTIDKIDNFAEIDQLVDLMSNSADEEFFKKIPDLIDMDNFYNWSVHLILAKSTHQHDSGNIRLYFNNVIGKFQLIPWDVGIDFMMDDERSSRVFVGNATQYHILVERILKNPDFLAQRDNALLAYVKNSSNLEDDLEFYDKICEQIRMAVYDDRVKNYTNKFFDTEIESYRNKITTFFNDAKLYLNKFDNTIINIRINFLKNKINLINELPVVFEIATDGFLPLELKELEIKKLEPQINSNFLVYYDSDKDGRLGKTDLSIGKIGTELDKIMLHPELGLSKTIHRFFIVPEKNIFEDIIDIELDFKIINSITGEKVESKKNIYIDENTFAHFDQISESASEFVTRYPAFRNIDNKNIILYAGSYVFGKDIIVPKNLKLEIKSGATLYFGENVSLISYSPVKVVGAKFLPLNYSKPWGVFGVVDVEEKSSFDYTVFEKGGEEYLNGIYFTGMLALHQADVETKNSEFKYATGDDGLNVKYGDVILTDSKFIQNEFDGVDFDFVKGKISNNQFLDNGNDGIDISGSNIKINKNIIKKSGDKGISVGEKSNPLIEDNFISGCDMGIAAKDLSEPEIKNNEIVENRIGIAAYRKKQIFGGAFPKVWSTIFSDNEKDTETDEFSTIMFMPS